jgi:AAA+ superfamily predicted ATPase
MSESHNTSSLPAGLTVEESFTNIASLSLTPALKVIIATVLKQWSAPDAFRPLAKYGIQPMRQLLFFGPPGNGKTSACQWIGHKLGVPLYRVRCDLLVGRYLGETAGNVGKLMDWLKQSPPAVILFDEVESLFPSRTDGSGACAREMSSAMTVFWQALDRWKGKHLFVLATNLPDRLDAALQSRIELHVEFGPPTEEQAREVVKYWSEVLHEYGAAQWSVELNNQFDDGHLPVSFRELWQTIQRKVSAHVTRSLEGN